MTFAILHPTLRLVHSALPAPGEPTVYPSVRMGVSLSCSVLGPSQEPEGQVYTDRMSAGGRPR